MKKPRTRPTRPQRLPDGQLDVDQPMVNGLEMSWNPDDDQWYVELPGTNGVGRAIFKERRNAMQWARGHRVEDYL